MRSIQGCEESRAGHQGGQQWGHCLDFLRGSLNGRGWHQRMRAILSFAIEYLCRGQSVLVHCWAGKHRSGIFAITLIALIKGWTWEEASRHYFGARPLRDRWDQNKVWSLCQKNGLVLFLAELVHEGFCADMLQGLRLAGVRQKACPAIRRSSGVLAKARPRQPSHPPPRQSSNSPPPPSSSSSSSSSEVVLLDSPSPLNDERLQCIGLRPKACPAIPKSSAPSRLGPFTGTPELFGRQPSYPPTSVRPRQPSYPPPPSPPPPPSSGSSSSNSGVVLLPRRATRSRSRRQARSRSASPLHDEKAWQCPRCEGLNMRSQMRCRGCQAGRPLLQAWVPGDWFCRVCSNHNFVSRVACNNPHCPTMKFKPGDWICTRCRNHNYARNIVCNTMWCKSPKPTTP